MRRGKACAGEVLGNPLTESSFCLNRAFCAAWFCMGVLLDKRGSDIWDLRKKSELFAK